MFGYSCGVRINGSVVCWGSYTYDYGRATPPDGEFVTVSTGSYHTCGVRLDGSVACWGDDSLGKATPPEGEFVTVSAGWGPYLWCEARRLCSLLGG